MVEFAGWEMPLYYSGIVREVSAVRTSVGIFDLSHMGELIVSGPQALDLVQFVTTNDASRLDVGKSQYALLCDESGGVIDDLFVYKLRPSMYMLVVNASNARTDFEWIQRHNNFNTGIENRSADMGLVAVQGPSSKDLLQTLVKFDLDTLPRFGIKQDRVGQVEAWIARTGYTGEDGFELYCSAPDSVSLWQSVLDAGGPFDAVPVGLGARDVLRLEAGYPLYGNELSRDVTPVEAGLLWAVKPEKGDFIGKEAILDRRQRGPNRMLVGFEAPERCIPRHGYELVADGTVIGEITSGTFSPTLDKGIAMGYVDVEHAVKGAEVEMPLRGKPCSLRIRSTRFYKSRQISELQEISST